MRRLSLRTQIVLLVLVVALLPLGLVGGWLTRSAARSGEELLVQRLDEALQRSGENLGALWSRRRTALLDIADSAAMIRVLAGPAAPDAQTRSVLSRLVDGLDPAIVGVSVRDTSDNVLWDYARGPESADAHATRRDAALAIRLPLHERATGRPLGTLVARLRALSLFSDGFGATLPAGLAMTVIDPASGASLLPVPFDASPLNDARFEWAGEEWIARRRQITDPRVDILVATPLNQFTQPFDAAARRGLFVLLVAALCAFAAIILLTRPMTRALGQLAAAADSVTAGNLEVQVDGSGRDEVGRVARAFNTMTTSLKRTLAELSRREALAAVGAFASELAHEVRNPLTSIRVDLQLVEEQLPENSTLRAIQAGVLDDIKRLDATVASVLRLARSGRIEARPLDAMEPVRAAIRAAQHQFDSRRASLVTNLSVEPILIDGDAAALTQVFVNLLVNAAQALPPGGTASVDAHVADDEAVVRVADNGCGIARDALDHIREPFFSTKIDGTGLGLAVAERTVRAHRGELRLESSPAEGTRVEVRLPLAHAVDGRPR